MTVKVIGLMVAALSLAGACSDGGGSDSVVGDVVTADAGWADAGPQRCKKVDIVFAMDASGTMKEEIEAMSVNVFPRFADALRNIGGGLEDYRIGFIDACPMPASFHTRGDSVTDCGFQSGEVWMDSTSTALNDEFACISDIYNDDIADFPGGCTGDNDDEQPIGATIAALSPPWSEGGNAGFLRDDALLVVVAITDEDEQPVPRATPEELYERLIAIKGGVDKVVFLGIGGASECIDPPGLYGQARESRRLKTVTELFEQHDRGVFWDLCGGRLEDGLTGAMSVIEGSCRRVD